MRIGNIARLLGAEILFGLLLTVLVLQPTPSVAQTRGQGPAADHSTPAAPAPDGKSAPDAAPPTEPESKAAPGVPNDASAVTLEMNARPVAMIDEKAEWANGFKSVMSAIDKVQAAVKKANLVASGRPFALFLATDDTSFQFEAMVPLTEKPDSKIELSDGVKIGESPTGKAIKFLHRGAYDDIDSTYDLITAFLDEKGLESQNRFIEEYLTDTKEPDDANLEADIYVFLK
ncbi:AraC family transcriptional regulator [Beijerinckiaceae bacterium]|nr:AraC family transcriptional regulator [Beijerinckiaceae bacterium]